MGTCGISGIYESSLLSMCVYQPCFEDTFLLARVRLVYGSKREVRLFVAGLH